MIVYIKDGAMVSIMPSAGAIAYAVDLCEDEKMKFVAWANESEIILHDDKYGKEYGPYRFMAWIENSTDFITECGKCVPAFSDYLRWSKFTKAQEQFYAWCNNKKILWIDTETGNSGPIIFSHWLDRQQFVCVDNLTWDAHGHGFEESNSGHFMEAL